MPVPLTPERGSWPDSVVVPRPITGAIELMMFCIMFVCADLWIRDGISSTVVLESVRVKQLQLNFRV